MRKIVDICPFCGKESLSYEGDFMIEGKGKDKDSEVKFCYDFMCENCCEEWSVWETYTLAEKKRWYSKYVEVEEDMLNENKKCTCDECCSEDNCKSEDEKPACETKDEDIDPFGLKLEVKVDEGKLKKTVDSIVDEAFEKAGKAAETPKGSWDDFFKVWEDLWVDLSKKEEPFKVTCGTIVNPNIKFGTINEVLDDLWRKPTKRTNSKGGHCQEK